VPPPSSFTQGFSQLLVVYRVTKVGIYHSPTGPFLLFRHPLVDTDLFKAQAIRDEGGVGSPYGLDSGTWII